MAKIPLTEIGKKALEKSIKSWEVTASQELPNNRWGKHCPLCKVFENSATEDSHPRHCVECPVALYTGKPFCGDTPYQAFSRAFPSGRKKAAIAEVEFLKEVLAAGLAAKREKDEQA